MKLSDHVALGSSGFFGLVGMAAFDRITFATEFTDENGAEIFEVDDLVFTAPVPLPATLPMLIAAFGAAGPWRHRSCRPA